MALAARHSHMSARQRKRALGIVIENQILPSLWLVTASAIAGAVDGKLTRMRVLVARRAPPVGSFVLRHIESSNLLRAMTVAASDTRMFTHEGKVRLCMIETLGPPVGRGMACVATSTLHLLSKLPSVAIAMARLAAQVGKVKAAPPVVAAHVTILAQHRRMRPRQWKTRSTMSSHGKRRRNEPERRVARFASTAEAGGKISTMIVHVAISTRIVCQLQGRTCAGGSRLMALLARNKRMLAEKLEGCLIMIEFARQCANMPPIRYMARTTRLLRKSRAVR